jgi:hypothetical protein
MSGCSATSKNFGDLRSLSRRAFPVAMDPASRTADTLVGRPCASVSTDPERTAMVPGTRLRTKLETSNEAVVEATSTFQSPRVGRVCMVVS